MQGTIQARLLLSKVFTHLCKQHIKFCITEIINKKLIENDFIFLISPFNEIANKELIFFKI